MAVASTILGMADLLLDVAAALAVDVGAEDGVSVLVEVAEAVVDGVEESFGALVGEGVVVAVNASAGVCVGNFGGAEAELQAMRSAISTRDPVTAAELLRRILMQMRYFKNWRICLPPPARS